MVPKQFSLHNSTTVSQFPGSYLYQISPSNDSLAVLTSSDEVFIVDQKTLQTVRSFPGVPKGATCLSGVRLLACSGRDGHVALFDPRSQERIIRLSAEENRAIASLALDDTRVACGTELARSQALVHVWDIRQNRMLWQSCESHNDDITQVKFHPTDGKYILSGSTDGLVSLSDTRIPEESGDALIQVINHGSIHKTGFLTDKTVYALSHDEQFSIHPVNNPEAGSNEPRPTSFGDIRLKASCDYAIDILSMNQGNVLVLGANHNKQQVQLIPLKSEQGWVLDYANAWSFPGAEEDEIVRSVYVNEASQTAFSAGEDGILRAFKSVEGEPAPTIQGSKTKKVRDQRFKPY